MGIWEISSREALGTAEGTAVGAAEGSYKSVDEDTTATVSTAMAPFVAAAALIFNAKEPSVTPASRALVISVKREVPSLL